MGLELRLPNITGMTEREQLSQVKSYLYQLVEQLQWALNNLDTTTGNAIANTPKTTPKSQLQIDSRATFDSIKSLIIKSSEIVDAYYEKINSKLVGEYVSQSDFGTYSEQTEQNIIDNSTEIERLFTNLQQITTDIESIEYTLVEVNAHIRSGLLYYDDNGVPIYGVEVGQKTKIDGAEVFDKFARFTSDKLSFYDQNDNEVAYISDRKLYINHVEVKGTFRIGGLVKTVLADGSIVKRWIGTGGEG